MADGGELSAAFRALAGDAAQAGEDIGDSMGRWFEDTADIEDENVSRTLAADAENARALNAIRPDPGNLPEGGAGGAAGDIGADGAGEPSRIAQILSGEDASADTPADPDAAQRALGEEMAADSNAEINRQINETLDKVNPKFDPSQSAYRENCTGVVQANELRRRGLDVQAGPLERPRWSSEGGSGGRPASAITGPWGGKFTPGTKADIEQAFKEPGSRGVVAIAWNGGGGHVFNVENVGGEVRFLDGQPTPPVTDAAHYFNMGHDTAYIRLDNRPTPPESATKPYMEP